ncbi:hypothetical protein FHG87_018610 [Trinorchestia longiramus]|nr:hypothetical protein FHG87_018610 [Trinorchestia longiramus]
MEVVTERLLNEERRQRGGPGTSDSSEKLLSGTKGYRLYDFNAKRILLSRYVVFNESQFMSFEKKPSEEIECVPCSFPQEEKHEDSEGELELHRSVIFFWCLAWGCQCYVYNNISEGKVNGVDWCTSSWGTQ